jgi:hypothetical protein
MMGRTGRRPAASVVFGRKGEQLFEEISEGRTVLNSSAYRNLNGVTISAEQGRS